MILLARPERFERPTPQMRSLVSEPGGDDCGRALLLSRLALTDRITEECYLRCYLWAISPEGHALKVLTLLVAEEGLEPPTRGL